MAKAEVATNPATSHPYYWAAFILAGDPRSLDGDPLSEPETWPERRPEGPPPVEDRRGCAAADRPDPNPGVAGLVLLVLGLRRSRREPRRGARCRARL